MIDEIPWDIETDTLRWECPPLSNVPGVAWRPNLIRSLCLRLDRIDFRRKTVVVRDARGRLWPVFSKEFKRMLQTCTVQQGRLYGRFRVTRSTRRWSLTLIEALTENEFTRSLECEASVPCPTPLPGSSEADENGEQP